PRARPPPDRPAPARARARRGGGVPARAADRATARIPALGRREPGDRSHSPGAGGPARGAAQPRRRAPTRRAPDPDRPGGYARAGVDTSRAERAVAGLVEVLRRIDPGHPSRAVLGSGHYANVLRIDDRTGIALSTDGVGTKVVVAEQLQRFDTVGIDCIAMNVNDVVCVGAEPIAVLDYVAVEEADPEMLRQIAEGLREGAEQAGVEIP